MRVAHVAFAAALALANVDPAGAVSIYNPGDILLVETNPIGGGAAQVVAIDPVSGQATTVSQGGLIGSPWGITLDANGDIFLSDNSPGVNRVLRRSARFAQGRRSDADPDPIVGHRQHSRAPRYEEVRST